MGITPNGRRAVDRGRDRPHAEDIFMQLSHRDSAIPSITWGELEGIFHALADTDAKRVMVRHLVEGTRKTAPFLPAEHTFREIVCIASALMDTDFHPAD